MHVMLDIETLGTRPDAAILQIGAVGFEMASGGRVYNGAKVFNQYVNPEGMPIDKDTFAWWLAQPEDCRMQMVKMLMTESISVTKAIGLLMDWPLKVFDMPWASMEGVWAHGSSFDFGILHTVFGNLGLKPPWRYDKIYDTRTLYLLAGGQPQVASVGTSHNAVDDCEYQICQLQTALQLMSAN